MIQAKIGSAPSTTLQELVLAAHFQAPLPLGVMDLAAWVSHFSDYPIVQELPPLSAVNLPVPGGPARMPAFEFVGMEASLPRMLVRSPDGRFSIQLQSDRLATGWARIEPLGSSAE